ncbi:MAG: hypothetical protein BJ554DRAFT_7752 [Olpidium bornovanus]|uniref:Uncharacterized protein n=1 Tax=Olpidium bornovanus TaxID=278681 RepID=A0A8H7ZVQ9_9FUNG|nr:MAG: hypothetical protein BJ554DRAFT_7752 [Olpidium bornovanus]
MYSQPTEGNRARVVVERADAEQFTEFAIRRTMLVDHLPNTYDREFTRARETIMLEGGRRARAVPNSSSEPGGRTDPSAFLPTDK